MMIMMMIPGPGGRLGMDEGRVSRSGSSSSSSLADRLVDRLHPDPKVGRHWYYSFFVF